MGYSTDFTGSFTLDKPLTAEQIEYLNMFSGTRRMKRNPAKISQITGNAQGMFNKDSGQPALNSRCLILIANLGLPIGNEGDFYCGPVDDFGQERDCSVVEYNAPPSTQPGLWCQWVPTEDGKGIEWNGSEKFYEYTKWLQYLISNFLIPWGYILNGEVKWQGEDSGDIGILCVSDNKLTVKKAVITYK